MLKSRYYSTIIVTLLIIGFILVLKYDSKEKNIGYEDRLFDDSIVHNIDIRPSDEVWNELMEHPENKTYLECDILIDGELFERVGIRAKGGTSLRQVKVKDNSNRFSLKVKFDKFNKECTYYGLDELVLNNTISDTTYLKEFFSYDMMREMGVAAPLTSFMEIRVNGEYYGFFIGIEGVDKSFLKRNYGNDYGELYKPKDMNKRLKEPNYYKTWGTDLVYTTDNIEDYAGIFNNSKTNPSDEDKKRLINSLKMIDKIENIEKYIDIDKTLRYFVVHNYVNNYDGYTSDILNNYHLYEKDGRLSMLPWDYNLAFGGFKGIQDEEYKGDVSKSVTHRIINLDIDNPLILIDPSKHDEKRNMYERPMWTKLMSEDKYCDEYHKLFREFIESYFKSGYFGDKLRATKNLIDDYVKNDSTSFYSYEDYIKGVSALEKYCLYRTESIENQLNGIDKDIEVGDLNLEDMGTPFIVDKELYFKTKELN